MTTQLQTDAGALVAAVLQNSAALASLQALIGSAAPASPTVAELWDHFTRKPKSANNQRTYGYIWHAQILPFFGHMRVDEITHETVEAWRTKRRKDKVRSRSSKPKYTTAGCRNSELRVLKSCLSWAVTTGKIGRNPLAGLKAEPHDGTRDTVIGEDDIARCLDFADLDMRAYILVCVGSGLRKMEAARLKWSDLDLENGVVWLPANLSKTKRRRTTLLTDQALECLRALRYPQAHDLPPGLSNVEGEVYKAIREGADTWEALKQRLKVSQPTLMPVMHRLAVRRLVERTPSPFGTGTQFMSTRGFKVLPFSYPGGAPDPLSPYVFPSPRDPRRPLPDATITARWDRIREKAGLKGPDGQVVVHDMRRTFGSNMIARGASLAEVLTLGGWANPDVFLRHYARIDPTRLQKLREMASGKGGTDA